MPGSLFPMEARGPPPDCTGGDGCPRYQGGPSGILVVNSHRHRKRPRPLVSAPQRRQAQEIKDVCGACWVTAVRLDLHCSANPEAPRPALLARLAIGSGAAGLAAAQQLVAHAAEGWAKHHRGGGQRVSFETIYRPRCSGGIRRSPALESLALARSPWRPTGARVHPGRVEGPCNGSGFSLIG
jgi:hypothetical protein